MGLLQSVSKGVLKQPPIIILYGDGGLGKDTWASHAPAPFFVDVEGGTGNLDVSRSPKPRTYDEALSYIDALLMEKHDYKTLVLSGLDALEALLFQKIVAEDTKGAKNMVQAAGGYGGGYKVAMEYWVQLQAKLTQVRDKGLQIIIILHPLIYTYNDPMMPTGYDRIRLKLHEGSKESACKLWFDYADAVFYAKKKVSSPEAARALEDGRHYIYTQGRAAFDAKSRFQLPFEIELDYSLFEKAMKHVKTAPELVQEINALAQEIKDEVQRGKVLNAVNQYKSSAHDLANILEQVKTILSKA